MPKFLTKMSGVGKLFHIGHWSSLAILHFTCFNGGIFIKVDTCDCIFGATKIRTQKN